MATKATKAKTKRQKGPEPGPGREAAQAVLQWLARQQPQMVGAIKQMVEIESPSSNKAAVDEFGKHLARELKAQGARVTVHPAKQVGDHLQADFPAGRGGSASAKPVMLLGHLDTVWEMGTLRTMPFQIQKQRLWGPGVYDMKTGIAQMMFAVRALQEAGGGLPRPTRMLLVSDEEIGSDHSRKITESLAKQCAAVLVCEPSQGTQGALKTWRKGVGDYTLRVSGRASHAGVDFTAGESAILELSRLLLEVAKFTDLERGITVNPGVVRGGTRSNVVPAEAVAEVDLRIKQLADAELVDKKFRALRPFNKNCRLEVTGGLNRPPMERSEGVIRLYEKAQQAGAMLRMDIRESGTGGGSDGNFTAALGIPTLDGLGAVGEGAHALHESVFLDEIPRRAALLALVIAAVDW